MANPETYIRPTIRTLGAAAILESLGPAQGYQGVERNPVIFPLDGASGGRQPVGMSSR